MFWPFTTIPRPLLPRRTGAMNSSYCGGIVWNLVASARRKKRRVGALVWVPLFAGQSKRRRDKEPQESSHHTTDLSQTPLDHTRAKKYFLTQVLLTTLLIMVHALMGLTD